MVLKVHNVDGSTKMIAIHEQMNARDVCILLAERNHKPIGPNWTLVEKLADLHLGKRGGDREREGGIERGSGGRNKRKGGRRTEGFEKRDMWMNNERTMSGCEQ